MKKSINYILSGFVAVSMLMVSCSKYEEGPAISLRSKTERVANTWKIEKAYRDGEDVTDSYDQYELQMLSDGDATLVSIYTFFNVTTEFESDGTWEFTNNKENLKLDFESDGADNTYQILKLKEDELWLREQGGEDELHLQPL